MNYKIEVKSKEQADEAQELFSQLGFSQATCSEDKYPKLVITNGDYSSGAPLDYYLGSECESVSLAELRALVSLHKNPINMDKVLSEVRSDALGLLNDQYAEIEQVRQEAQAWANRPVGRCRTVPIDAKPNQTTINAMNEADTLFADAESSRHNHYFIDVSDVDEVDFYEIALRYNVTDPCVQHILKKCLAVGNRGHKDFHTDLKDIYDTAARALRIHGG